jgi:nuclear RNA export factor
MPNQKKLEWTQYLTSGSRNLSRMNTVARAEKSLQTGPKEIVAKLSSLPGTRHDITAQDKFVVDAWPVHGVLPLPGDASTVLFISVHGQFEEGESTYLAYDPVNC